MGGEVEVVERGGGGVGVGVTVMAGNGIHRS